MENKKIVIAQIVGKMVGGGVEAVVMNYYRHIDKDKFQFDFIVTSDSTRVPLDEIEAFGGRVLYIPPIKNPYSYMKSLYKIFKENKYSIVHSHVNTLSVFSLACARFANVPMRISHAHSTTNKDEKLRNLAKNILKNFSKIFANEYFACGKYAGEFQFGKNSNFTIINNAFELDKFKFSHEYRKNIRAGLGIKDSDFVIGHVGRFRTQKNHKFLIDIFQEILFIKPNSKLLLLGDGELLNDIVSYVKEKNIYDMVIFAGNVNDVYKYYSAMDVFVLPSLYEGLPVVGLEAQVASLPCVFSDEITKEIQISTSSAFLSLSTQASIWAKEIVNIYNSKDKHNTLNIEKYNISNEVKKLEGKYMFLINKVKR